MMADLLLALVYAVAGTVLALMAHWHARQANISFRAVWLSFLGGTVLLTLALQTVAAPRRTEPPRVVKDAPTWGEEERRLRILSESIKLAVQNQAKLLQLQERALSRVEGE